MQDQIHFKHFKHILLLIIQTKLHKLIKVCCVNPNLTKVMYALPDLFFIINIKHALKLVKEKNVRFICFKLYG